METCKKYIREMTGESLDLIVLEFPSKNMLGIADVDLYHKIAQSLNIHKLRQSHGNLYYGLKIPEELYTWTIALIGNNDLEFKNRYGNQYMITQKKEFKPYK